MVILTQLKWLQPLTEDTNQTISTQAHLVIQLVMAVVDQDPTMAPDFTEVTEAEDTAAATELVVLAVDLVAVVMVEEVVDTVAADMAEAPVVMEALKVVIMVALMDNIQQQQQHQRKT